jgi:hypothetical protein
MHFAGFLLEGATTILFRKPLVKIKQENRNQGLVHSLELKETLLGIKALL